MIKTAMITRDDVAPPNKSWAYLVFIESVVYQESERQPFGVSRRSMRRLDGISEPHEQQLLLTSEWQTLSYGWVDNPGMIVIENLKPTYKHEETEIEIAMGEVKEPLLTVPSGEMQRLNPLASIHLRCRSKKARCAVTAFTR